MANDKIRLYGKFILVLVKYGFTRLYQRVQAAAHSWTYRQVPSPKNVVILGGSFAGVQLAKRLAETLPTGYRVVLVENNSHFNYVFNFPRYVILQGHEQKAFVPYAGFTKGTPEGVFKQVRDLATGVGDGEVELKSGDRIKFEYLAIATGTRQNAPAQVRGTEKRDGCAELRDLQEQIEEAKIIAIVGGGPVGVQLAGDIKTFFEEKRVMLIHSRDQLLPNFGKKLHYYVVDAMAKLGMTLRLGERPKLSDGVGPATLQFKDGGSEEFDLVIPCTGQSPNSFMLARFGPEAISTKTGRILVKPTLQVLFEDHPSTNQFNVFAFGDVAETVGPKMGRAGMIQADIVTANILSLIRGSTKLKAYAPIPLEGALKLSLGKEDCVMYLNDQGDEILVPMKSGSEDLEVEKIWKMFNSDAKMSEA